MSKVTGVPQTWGSARFQAATYTIASAFKGDHLKAWGSYDLGKMVPYAGRPKTGRLA
jgi:hypothetical protein